MELVVSLYLLLQRKFDTKNVELPISVDCPFSNNSLLPRTLNTKWSWMIGSPMKILNLRRNLNMELTTAPSFQCNMIEGTTFQVSFPFGSIGYTYPTFVTTSGSGVLFSNRCTFFAKRMRNVGLFWPLFGPIWSICRKFTHFWWFSLTDLRSVVVYRNWQISGMSRYHSQRSNDLPSIFCGNIDWTYFVIQLVTSNLAVGGTALAWRRARTSQARNRRSAKKIVRRIVEMLLWFHKILLNLLFCIGNLCSLLESDSWF